MKKWYEIVNKTAEKAEIWIYEQIGQDWWTGDGLTAKSFQKDLSEIKATQIDLHINSPGGEVFDGITIYNLLKHHQATITTYIDGLAASIASVIALSGDKIFMAENALYMLHNPYGMVMGTADDMRKMADMIDKVKASLMLAYTGKTDKSDDEIAALMDAETWLSAEEALEFGFIDEITGQIDMAACAKFLPVMEKAKFQHIPQALTGTKPVYTERDFERMLRRHGYNQEDAKTITAKGFRALKRDVDGAETAAFQADSPQRDAAAVVQRDAEPPKPEKQGYRIIDRHERPQHQSSM